MPLRLKSPLTEFCSTVCSGQLQKNIKSLHYWSFVNGIRWPVVSHTKGLWFGKCFLFMTSSWNNGPPLTFLGQNTAEDTLFTYTTGSWTSYTNPSFVPLFFNPDLTVMFSDSSTRLTAIQLCYDSQATSDPNPSLHRACYYDFAVTGSSAVAGETAASETDFSETVSTLSMSFGFLKELCSKHPSH